jgi:hypothetical protein
VHIGRRNIITSEGSGVSIGDYAGKYSDNDPSNYYFCAGDHAQTVFGAGNRQINICNSFRVFHFPSTWTKGSVYAILGSVLQDGTDVGVIGNFGAVNLTRIMYDGTTIVLVNNVNNNTLSLPAGDNSLLGVTVNVGLLQTIN